MAAIDLERPPAACSSAALWPWVAQAVQRWLAVRGVPARDAVLLLPYAALLPLARQALVAAGGWQPRVETVLTLAESLSPRLATSVGGVSGDALRDRLRAAALLRRQPWAAERERHDGAGFAQLAALLADAAQVLHRRAAALPTGQRDAFWSQARAALPGSGGPAALEASLAGVAIEWAALEPAAAHDALFAHRPSAWIVARLGGADDVAEAVLHACTVPALLIDADPDVEEPFQAFLAGSIADARRPLGARWICADFAAEAEAAASVAVQQIEAGRRPLALITADRVLARRVRALLESAGLVIADETGWRLSTTVAAASLMALLRAARSDASRDDCLEWLKTLVFGRAAWLDALERQWRGGRDAPAQGAAIEAHWREAERALLPWRQLARRPLLGWLELLHQGWQRDPLQPDVLAVEQALHLLDADSGWRETAGQTIFDLRGFAAWVDEVLDGHNLEPPRAADPDVVLTPLARALGRPFAHVLLPAADAQHLGAVQPQPSLIPPAMARSLGLVTPEQGWQRRQLAVAQLLRMPAVTWLRRRHEGIEPVASSPLVKRLAADAVAAGLCWPETQWQPLLTSVPRTPFAPVAPRAPAALPVRLSASAIEALRDCPYRFFSRSVLRLHDSDELEAEAGKREYGEWLHATLDEFHRHHDPLQDEAAQFQRAGDVAAERLSLDAAELLPYRASAERLMPDYLAWLRQRLADGWRWSDGEAWFSAEPEALAPHGLHGRLDRIDRRHDGQAELIDYKTGSLEGLRDRLREPLEDTQLIFYAALLRAAHPELPPLRASYLALDDPAAPTALAHEQIERDIAPLLQGLGADLAALRAGAPMLPLGEGRVCEHCEARGLCRRDHRPVPQFGGQA